MDLLCKKAIFKNFAKFMLTGLQLYHKTGLHNRCFPANSAKLLATPFCFTKELATLLKRWIWCRTQNSVKFLKTPFVHKTSLSDCLRPATLFKKRLWHRCFPVNFAKFLRTPLFTEHLWATASSFLDVLKKIMEGNYSKENTFLDSTIHLFFMSKRFIIND